MELVQNSASGYSRQTHGTRKKARNWIPDRITVWKGYRLEINFNVTYEEFGSVII